MKRKYKGDRRLGGHPSSGLGIQVDDHAMNSYMGQRGGHPRVCFVESKECGIK